MAILFDTIPRLRGAVGTAVYFLLYLVTLTVVAIGELPGTASGLQYSIDPFGMRILYDSMASAIPGGGEEFGTFALASADAAENTIVWPGLSVTPATIFDRLLLLGVGTALVMVSAKTVDLRPEGTSEAVSPESLKTDLASNADRPGELSSLPTLETSPPSMPRRIIAELQLVAARRSRWWYLAILFVISVGYLAGSEAAPLTLAVAWLLPLSVWSTIGVGERRYRLSQILDTTPRPHDRVFASWGAGAVIGLVAAAGVCIALAVDGQLVSVGGIIVGAAFLPALSLAVGAVTGSGRLFEVLYLTFWYIGLVNATPPLDFSGLQGGPIVSGIFGGFTVVLLLITIVRRR